MSQERHTVTKPRSKPFANGDGHWFISLLHADFAGSTPWPSPGTLEFDELAGFLLTLTATPRINLKSVQRAQRTFAHKPLQMESLSSVARDRLNQLAAEAEAKGVTLPMDEIWSFTYCLEENAPHRVLVLAEGPNFYALWWDPDHLTTGSLQMKRAPRNICSGKFPCTHLRDSRLLGLSG